MKETFYLFVFDDGSSYEMTCAVSFKDAVWEMSKYTNEATEMFHNCLRGFESGNVNGIIDLFNHFAYKSIIKVYEVKEKVYDELKE